MKCPACEGKGFQVIHNSIGRLGRIITCQFCLGNEELDWIESVFGVDKPVRIDNPYQGKIRYDTKYQFPSKW